MNCGNDSNCVHWLYATLTGTSTTMSFSIFAMSLSLSGVVQAALLIVFLLGLLLMTCASGPCQVCRKSCASRTSSFVKAGVFSSSRSTIATLDSPHTVHASFTTSACGSAVIPRTAQLASRAPHAGHSIVRMRSRIAPIQSMGLWTATPTPRRDALARPATEHARACGQPLTTSPPFGCSTWPDMYEASSLARYTNDGATSSGCPTRPIGVSFPNEATLSASNVDGMSGVQMGPGATAFTRMPRSASESASERVNDTIAPLVDE